MPEPGEVPRLAGIDVWGSTRALRGAVGGDHLICVDFKQRCDLQARIAEAEARGAATVVDGLRRCGHRASITVLDAAGHQMTDALLAAMIPPGVPARGAVRARPIWAEDDPAVREPEHAAVPLVGRAQARVPSLRGGFRGGNVPVPFGRAAPAGRVLAASRPIHRRRGPSAGVGARLSASSRRLHVIDRAATESPFGFKDGYEVNEWALLGLGDILLLYADGVSEHAEDRYFPERLDDQSAQSEAPLGSGDKRGDPRRHACVQCAGRRYHAGDRQAGIEPCGNGTLHGVQRRAAPDLLRPEVRRHAVIGAGPQPRARGSQPIRAYRTRRCSRYSTAARIWPASHVVQSSLSGSPGTPVPRPTATSLITRCCEPWCSHRARNRCVRPTEGSSFTHEHRSPETAGRAGGECG